jgi:hypothetical protein
MMRALFAAILTVGALLLVAWLLVRPLIERVR